MPGKNKNAPVVAVLNMKGGVGKTTIAGNLFRELFRDKKVHTLLIDLDAQFNLTQLLMTRKQYDSLLDNKKTIFSVFQHEIPDSVFAISEEYHLELPLIDDLVENLEKHTRNEEDVKLDLLPGDFELATLNLKARSELRIPKKRFKRFVENAKQQYQLVVIDCNPSTSFLTSCALEVASHLLIPVKPDKYSRLGVEMVLDYAKAYLGKGLVPDIKILLNDMRRDNTNDNKIARELRGHRELGSKVLVNELKHSELLIAKPDHTGFATDQKVPYKEVVKNNLVEIANEYYLSLVL
ncbi:ParA family protein [Candidatus Parabeggiatoa sp. HSG14]|uniref:ParA family protein n=1 Tax=Candidatus Parabeggiatoa sp. HSG14 TaxID=3055593 RepID=UPI0025A6EE1C|nr:ParA family protein [Thiotrichales bacterium HSG14]